MERAGMHKKPIYGGRIYSDHGNRKSTAWCIPGNGDSKIKVHCEAAQDMDLFLHARPLFLMFTLLLQTNLHGTGQGRRKTAWAGRTGACPKTTPLMNFLI
jgi:hypothetical protein